MKTFNRLAALLSSISWCFVSVRAVAPGADLPDPPQCEQLLDCTWSEQGEGRHAEKYESLCQNIPVEAALEATEFTVSAMEAENCPVTIKHNRSSLEGSVIIEMSAQPLLELTPMTGSFVFTSHCCRTHLLSILKWDIRSVSVTLYHHRVWVPLTSDCHTGNGSFGNIFFVRVTHDTVCCSCWKGVLMSLLLHLCLDYSEQ